MIDSIRKHLFIHHSHKSSECTEIYAQQTQHQPWTFISLFPSACLLPMFCFAPSMPEAQSQVSIIVISPAASCSFLTLDTSNTKFRQEFSEVVLVWFDQHSWPCNKISSSLSALMCIRQISRVVFYIVYTQHLSHILVPHPAACLYHFVVDRTPAFLVFTMWPFNIKVFRHFCQKLTRRHNATELHNHTRYKQNRHHHTTVRLKPTLEPRCN